MAGDDVERLQERLTAAGVRRRSGRRQLRPLTQQAVWAYEKLVLGVPRSRGDRPGDARDVEHDAGSDRRSRRAATGGLADHVEIYLPQQVMVIFHADVPVLVAHISSGQQNPDGTPFEYSDDVTIDTDEVGNPLPEPITKPIKGLAKTPPGVFSAGREVTGERNGPLGTMWDPVYINQGIAIHGANNVPLEPASHGCIRVSRYLGPIVQEPDRQGRLGAASGTARRSPSSRPPKDRQMIWDWVDLVADHDVDVDHHDHHHVGSHHDAGAGHDQAPPATTAAPTTTPPPTTSTTTPTTRRAGRRALRPPPACQRPNAAVAGVEPAQHAGPEALDLLERAADLVDAGAGVAEQDRHPDRLVEVARRAADRRRRCRLRRDRR